MIRGSLQYLLVTVLVLGISYAAMTYMANRTADVFNAGSALIADPSSAAR